LPTRVVAYLRCSTKKQDLESQRRVVAEWAERNGHELLPPYEDDAVSGRKSDRSGIQALMAAAERGEFSLVAVSELSRIGRSIGFVTRTVETLCQLDVRVVLVNSGTTLDYRTLEGRALIGALALAADIEMALIQERSARGRETIRRRGIRVGRKPVAISPTVLRSLRERGMSIRQIARELGVSSATVGRRVKHLEQSDKV
jgi:putative DNA-invertase from lambdoid prophage Rac